MRKFLLYSSALAVFGLSSSVAEAACIQTPTCSSLGYTSTSSCTGGTKCPFGNYWNCDSINKIIELEKTIEELQTKIIVMNCKVGDILYSDMTCNTNLDATKTAIGVVFDATNGLAIAKSRFFHILGAVVEDISSIQNYNDKSSATKDLQGFNNTKAMYEADKSGTNYPAIKEVLNYSTEGTEKGQWYVPSIGELQKISINKNLLNAAFAKIGISQLSGDVWSSSEENETNAYYFTIGNNNANSGKKVDRKLIIPIINFANSNKTEFTYVNSYNTNCFVGSILYSDKKCYAGSAPKGKTAIAIVFDAKRHTAIGLQDFPYMLWAYNRAYAPGTPIYNRDQAIQDFNGKSYIETIKAYDSNFEKFPAAKYAYNYKTDGTTSGEWYIPALGELYTVYNNYQFLHYSTSLIHRYFSSGYVSSTLLSSDRLWTIDLSDGDMDAAYTGASLKFRPVLNF